MSAAGPPRYDPLRHHRRSLRLKGYDYSTPGTYFITICTHSRLCLLGEVEGEQVCLSPAGRVAVAAWQSLPARFPVAGLDNFVVMPNHLHALLCLTGADDVGAPFMGAQHEAGSPSRAHTRPREGIMPAPTGDSIGAAANMVGAPLMGAPGVDGDARHTRAGTKPASTMLGAIVGAFKSITTGEYARGVHNLGWPPFPGRLWQRNYYERVVRSEAELEAIRAYIARNPARWLHDQDNPGRAGNLSPETVLDYLAFVLADSKTSP